MEINEGEKTRNINKKIQNLRNIHGILILETEKRLRLLLVKISYPTRRRIHLGEVSISSPDRDDTPPPLFSLEFL